MNDACPDDAELERLLADQLSEAAEEILERHVVGGEACQRRLDELTEFAGTDTDVAPQRDNGADPPSPDGVLAPLASSSRPLLRLAEGESGARKAPNESFARRLGSSATLLASGRFVRRQFWTWPLIAAALLGGVG